MNILPKKRWHVRTRENIARVRKDEQQAREESEEKKQRILKAEQEARTALLRQRARAKYGIVDNNLENDKDVSKHEERDSEKHVNFFEDLEEGKIVSTKSNVETEKEEKDKREKYEKQIGFLTYLGQDTVEATGNIPWYDKVPNRFQANDETQEEKHSKAKLLQDPLTLIKKYLPSEIKVNKSEINVGGKTQINIRKSESKVLLDSEPYSKHKHREKRKKKKHKKVSKKRKRSSSSESVTDSDSSANEEEIKGRKRLEQLRAERLKREREERQRTEQLLAKLQGKDLKQEKQEPETPTLQRKYNSQYNPELAKQNFSLHSKYR